MASASPFSLDVIPGPFGAAETSGVVPIRDAGDAAACDRLRRALWTHGVVCVRFARPLDDASVRALVSMIGNVKDLIARTPDGRSLRYGDDRQIMDSGFVMTDEIRAELGKVTFGGDSRRPGLFEFFHTDDSYTEAPAAATVLHARALPPGGGGDTHFIDMRAAFQLLDPVLQERIAPLRAVHAYNNRNAFPPRTSARGPLEELRDVAHPVVRAHPVTGVPALYFDLDRATEIVGMNVVEGRALLQSLQDHAEEHAPRYAHAWHPHDVLIWDNAAVQHKAGGDFRVGEARRFWRYMVEGTRPEEGRGRH